MRGTELKDGQHSTPDPSERSQLWPRVLGSLALFGLLIGLMIGRLTNPEPARLDNIEVHRDQLVLWFNDEPKVHAEVVGGTVAILFDATGAPASGRLLVDGKPVTWRIQRSEEGLLLTAVAARPLQMQWRAVQVDGRWQTTIELGEQ
ncbi:hypothetical protein [Pseudomonas sp. PS01301]|uniref:hypothetical protein n=1 Tax=Pseudomonas sp. PS01301 TaxID=2991437 RepID=UPI00249C296F|nr:hypothetical protein [Pseudomonas sp. PS01301]